MSMSTVEGRDFPFYGGRPKTMTAARGALILLGCASGLVALMTIPHVVSGPVGGWVAAALFALFPLAALAGAVGREWRSLFHRPTVRDIGVGLAFAPLCFVASAVPALLLMRSGLTSDNPVFGLLQAMHGQERLIFFALAGLQLLGEELITILPFLVLLAWAGRILPRRWAVAAAWIATALMFGAIHLPTYHWRLEQSLLVIGAARLVLTAAYLLTKNLWTSFIAHVANDWALLALGLVLAART